MIIGILTPLCDNWDPNPPPCDNGDPNPAPSDKCIYKRQCRYKQTINENPAYINFYLKRPKYDHENVCDICFYLFYTYNILISKFKNKYLN